MPKLPNLIIIGGMKCGTTSMHHYLDEHPQIAMSRIKELNYFLDSEYNKYSLDWYMSNFEEGYKVVGESSTSYSKYPVFKDVPERMHRILPDVKIIYLLRDPIERIVSNYRHNVIQGRENRSFSDAMKAKDAAYIQYSLYYSQLQHYLRFFLKEQILVLSFKDLECERRKVLKKAFQFLGVDKNFYCDAFGIKHYETAEVINHQATVQPFSKRSEMLLGEVDKIARQSGQEILKSFSFNPEILALLRDDATEIRKFSGLELNTWSV